MNFRNARYIFIPNSVLNEDIRTLIPKPPGKI